MLRWNACGLGLITVAAAAAAQPPVEPEARLRDEAHAVRREQVELFIRAAEQGECDDLRSAAVAVRRLADEAAVRDGRAAGVAWAERWAAAHQLYLESSTRTPGMTKARLLRVVEAKCEADIDLARRRGAGPAALIPLYRARVELLTEAEKLAAEGGRGTTRAEALALRVARLDAQAELAAAEAATRKGDR